MAQDPLKPARKRITACRPDTASANKMSQLIEAAEDIFLAKGYHTATMSDVAKAACMSKKTVYQLIDSKADLFTALLAHYQAKLVLPEEEDGQTIQETLVQNLLCLAEFLFSPQQIAIIRLIMAEYTHSSDLGRIFHQKRLIKAKNQMENCLIKVATRAGLKLADAREMSAMLFGMALGEYYSSLLLGLRQTPKKAVLECRIRHAVDIFLSGFDGFSHP